jgi:hypothetical protein
VGTKALHLNAVSPKLLWPIPYCSTTGVAQLRLGCAAPGIASKVNMVATAIIAEAIELENRNLFFIDFTLSVLEWRAFLMNEIAVLS